MWFVDSLRIIIYTTRAPSYSLATLYLTRIVSHLTRSFTHSPSSATQRLPSHSFEAIHTAGDASFVALASSAPSTAPLERWRK
jgi:hypothetical protein